MKKVLVSIIVLFALTNISKAGIGPSGSGLSLDTLHPNRDSAYVDTNSASPTYKSFYCRNGYEIRFNYYVITSPVYNEDTTLYFEWTAIDTAHPAIRSAFARIDSIDGHFTIAKPYPYITDTSSFLNKDFFIRFDSLLDVDSALVMLEQIPGATVAWRGRPVVMADIPAVNGLVPGLDFSKLTPDGSSEFTRYLHPLGWQWSIYKLHCPMAWEITKGLPYWNKAPGTNQKYIHVVGDDEFYPTSQPSTNPDIVPNFVQMTVGGSTGEQSSGIQSHGDGATTLALGDGHGHGCLSQAIAAGANSMIGTCPECKGITVTGVKPPNGAEPYGIDVDGISENGITVPEVEWSSADESVDFIGCMKAGIAIFSAAGNTLDCYGCGQDNNYEPNPANSSQTFLYPQVEDWPGYTAFIDGGSDPTKDVHPLCVGGDMDRTIDGLADECPPYNGTDFRCAGPEQFAVAAFGYIPYNFSCGLDKFSTSSDITARINHKKWAFMDVTAPAEFVLFARSNAPSTGYPTDYGVEWGTSFSAPEVAGIAGLMRSINYDVTPDGSTLTSPQIQAGTIQLNINNIITFTADKIPDFDNIGSFTYPNSKIIPKGFPSTSSDNQYTSSTSGLRYSGMPSAMDPNAYVQGNWQYSYVKQTNDPLSRSWAQRVGFGRVNAYRAVANSIPDRAPMVYTGPAAAIDYSAATQNENSQYLVHMGAYRPANGYRQDEDGYKGTESNATTTTTLTAGGVIVPNQSPTPWPYENEGETFLYSTGGAVNLTVGDLNTGNKQILAIDGNLIGDDAANNKITSNVDGKVLITGYMRDVEITGDSTKVDDEIIDGTANDGYSKIEVDAGNMAEIYGVIHLQHYGNFVVNGGTLTIQPGGEIDMDGSKDFEITSGTVKMMASTKLACSTGSTTHQVIVDNGANLIIAGLLPVDILATLHVKAGGTVTINAGAFFRLDKFIIDQNGTLTVLSDPSTQNPLPGGRLTLNKVFVKNLCNGKFLFNGVAKSRCTLTAGVSLYKAGASSMKTLGEYVFNTAFDIVPLVSGSYHF